MNRRDQDRYALPAALQSALTAAPNVSSKYVSISDSHVVVKQSAVMLNSTAVASKERSHHSNCSTPRQSLSNSASQSSVVSESVMQLAYDATAAV